MLAGIYASARDQPGGNCDSGVPVEPSALHERKDRGIADLGIRGALPKGQIAYL
jgi:hypothetical protein